MKYILIIIISIFFLISCSDLKEGIVYDKKFYPKHTILIMQPIVHYTHIGKMSIAHVTNIPIWYHYPDSWSISYKAFNEYKNKWITNTVYVDYQTWQNVKIGDRFIKQKNHNKEPKRIKLDKD